MSRRIPYDVALLRELWARGEEGRAIAQRLGISTTTLSKEASRLGLPKRPRRRASFMADDEPTPEQVAEYESRRAEVWQRHLEAKRNGSMA